MNRMKPIDNLEFRQALMEIIKRYVYKRQYNPNSHQALYQFKQEMEGAPEGSYQEDKKRVFHEINKSIGKRRPLSEIQNVMDSLTQVKKNMDQSGPVAGSGDVLGILSHVEEVKQEVRQKVIQEVRPEVKLELKQENIKLPNPLATTFADAFVLGDENIVLDISDSDNEVEEVEIHIVTKKTKR